MLLTSLQSVPHLHLVAHDPCLPTLSGLCFTDEPHISALGEGVMVT